MTTLADAELERLIAQADHRITRAKERLADAERYRAALVAEVVAQINGKTTTEEQPRPPVVDLMAALLASLSTARNKTTDTTKGHNE